MIVLEADPELLEIVAARGLSRESGMGKSRKNCVARTENLNAGSRAGRYDRQSVILESA